MTEIELLSYPDLSKDEEKRIYGFLGRVNVIEMTADVKREAIALRKAHRFRPPYAIVAATAIALQAELWTNDAALAKISGLNCASPKLVE